MINIVGRFIRCASNKFGQPIAQFSSECIRNRVIGHESVQNAVNQTYGQPTAFTHPHLMKEGEVVPGIQLDEFKKRRSLLMEKIIPEKTKSDRPQIVVIPSSSKVYMSENIPYVYRQNSDFLYFTGCQEPDSILVLIARNNECKSFLFIRGKNEHSELWDGPRTGIDAASEMFGVDQALVVTEFEKFLTSFLNEHENSIIWYDNVDVIQESVHLKLAQLIKLSKSQVFVCPKLLIHQIRLIKSTSEIDLMQKTCEVASAAITKTIEISKPGMTEHQLYATVDYECRMNGAEYLAYPPVVASGKNANIIHYVINNQVIQNGDMVLMDAGCEYHGYTSDITRTWPINGTFTPNQRLLYEIVLETQKNLIDKLKDMPTLDQQFENMCWLLGERLREIGLIPKHFRGNKLLAAAYSYCPHHVSHYLGMDVHDTVKISKSVKLQPGMIVTIEPGVYVSPKNQFAPSEFHDLGVRIEDDVLITENGPVVLTKNCPKEISDIETLASRNQR